MAQTRRDSLVTQYGRRQKWLPLFLKFLAEMRIDSKEKEAEDDRGSKLELWGSQRRFLEDLCDGLENNIHEFYYLKSRQAGITTIGLTIILFWLAAHPRTIGCLVADNDRNVKGFREVITKMAASFPPGFVGTRFRITKNNKDFLLFSNGSRLDLLFAGNKETWAKSKGYSLAWLSEVSKYGSQAGIDSFKETMAQSHPNRLFIFESTANGPNHWQAMWDEAGDDTITKRRCFIGWWAKELNSLIGTDPLYGLHGLNPPNQIERELINAVAKEYGHVVSQNQLAWYRYRNADSAQEASSLDQNQPWTAKQSFVSSGYSFFQMRTVVKKMEEVIAAQIPFKGYRFYLGNDFFSISMEQITSTERLDEVELRVWEEPVDGAQYAIGFDPAYGRTEWADRHACSVWRCYGDKLVQVAEYADHRVETYQAAWILAYLAGAYKDCLVNLELGGPGRSVLQEFNNLRLRLRADVNQAHIKELGWEDFLDTARWYLYHRPDSPGGGYVHCFETTWRTKMELINQFRDNFSTDVMLIKSLPLLKEMTAMIQEKSEIAPSAPGLNKDDRVFAAALANRTWLEWIRQPMLAMGSTYEVVSARERGEETGMSQVVQKIVYDFFRSVEERSQNPEVPTWMSERGFV